MLYQTFIDLTFDITTTPNAAERDEALSLLEGGGFSRLRPKNQFWHTMLPLSGGFPSSSDREPDDKLCFQISSSANQNLFLNSLLLLVPPSGPVTTSLLSVWSLLPPQLGPVYHRERVTQA